MTKEKKTLKDWIEKATREGTYFHNYRGFGGDVYGIPVEDYDRIMNEELTQEEFEAKAMLCSQSNLQTAKEQARDE